MKIFLIFLFIAAMAFGAHKLIRRLIDPKQSAAHLFLYFLAHFLAIFLCSFLVNYVILRFSGVLFR
jgi:uncharacterized membrane protein YgdD (TMEM256/DUF423 family)